jgi:hypothetical protein
MDTEQQEKHYIELGQKNKQLLVIMRPTNFQPSEYTAQDNHFMDDEFEYTPEEIKDLANKEHRAFEQKLVDHNIAHKVFEQTDEEAHDSCFISDSLICIRNADFPKGVIFICPMHWPNRRREKHPTVYKWLQEKLGYETLVDFSHYETEDKALEGKGVTLFDWETRTIYVGESKRAHKDVIKALADKMSELSGKQYNYVLVQSWDEREDIVHFHTSSYFMIYNKCAVICSEVIKGEEHLNDMIKALQASGKEVLECTYEDMENGATLGVEFIREDGTNGVLFSDFCNDLSDKTKDFFKRNFNELVYIVAPVLVDIGGSSVECMIQTVPLY